MPHVVIEGPTRVSDYAQHFVPITQREGADLIKVERFYLHLKGHSALLETLVIEQGVSQKFYVILSDKGNNQLSVHLDPLTDPNKTPGVKKALALIAREIQALHPDNRFVRTNIQEFLD